MAVFADLGAWALDKLRNTTAVTDLVVDGAAMILEAREPVSIATLISEAQETRREAGDTQKVLAIIVQDFGEQGLEASCGVFVYDRYGYVNIREVREAVILALVNCPVMLARDAQIIAVHYGGRTGHIVSTQFDVDFERVDFDGPLVTENDYYS